jgi:ATP/maltotriose-dependent transcriptional regulator MalT
MGQLAGAADAFRQCLAHQREPRARYGVYLVLAETLHQSGDAAGALSVLDSAVQVAPENRASVEEARARFASGTTGF